MELFRTDAITDAVYHPIDPSLFTIPSSSPPITLRVGPHLAHCRHPTGCGYQPSPDNTPTLTSVSISALNVEISGLGLATDWEGESGIPPVRVGNVSCEVATRTDAAVTCTLPHEPLPGINRVLVRSA
jgi:hypothetical protein